ncbi:MAG: hypothetical protein QOH10_199 [Actinomycetota bacterium]|jgi:hypothetical protein|nr:hypothetical protein [Actinomycetota bacterium]
MGPSGPALALACRLVLAVVLAVAGVAKIADRRALPGRLRAMGIAPRWSVRVAVGLPIAELGVAAALVGAPRSPLPAVAALALLAGFTVFLVAAARRAGHAVPCPCFGTVRTARAASGPAAIVRNGVLLALGVIATGPVDGARVGGTLLAAGVAAAATVAVARVA